MNPTTSHADNITSLAEKIKGIRIAMLTTVEPDGKIISRPMATQEATFDGTLWFFTQASTPKVEQTQHNQHVNVAYAKPDVDRFISTSGTAELVRDRQQIHALWKPFLVAWFPKGEDDPDLALLKITIDSAEIWEGPSNPVVRFVGLAKAVITHHYDQGKDQKIDLNG